MILLILGCLFLITIYYFYLKKKDSLEKEDNFIPSDSFNGAKEGYIFKKCVNGLGYYKDKINT